MNKSSKTCIHCNENKLLTEFSINNSHKDKLESVCKKCKSKRTLEYSFGQHSNDPKWIARYENRYMLGPKGEHRCTKCTNIYPLTREFYEIHNKNRFTDICTKCCTIRRAELAHRKRNNPEWYCRSLLKSLKYRAKEQLIPYGFSTPNYLYQLWLNQKGLCYYTNEPMDFMAHTSSRLHPHNNYPSVDKLTPKLGYVDNNIVWCKYRINVMKQDLSKDEFITFSKVIASRF
jgi:hypothetical protein